MKCIWPTVVLLLVASTACNAQPRKPLFKPLSPIGSGESWIEALRTFTVNDFQAALDDALAQVPPDEMAATCYEAMIPLMQSTVSNPLPSKPGLMLLFQKSRDLARRVESAKASLASDEINKACAPLVLDAGKTILALKARAISAAAAIAILVPK